MPQTGAAPHGRENASVSSKPACLPFRSTPPANRSHATRKPRVSPRLARRSAPLPASRPLTTPGPIIKKRKTRNRENKERSRAIERAPARGPPAAGGQPPNPQPEHATEKRRPMPQPSTGRKGFCSHKKTSRFKPLPPVLFGWPGRFFPTTTKAPPAARPYPVPPSHSTLRHVLCQPKHPAPEHGNTKKPDPRRDPAYRSFTPSRRRAV